MADFDRFDSPSSLDDLSYQPNGAMSELGGNFGGAIPQVKDFLMQHGKKLAVVLILLIIGFFAYDYFIGSIVNYSITIEDTEGKIIGGVTGKILSSSGEKIKDFAGGEINLSLRTGEYTVKFDPQDIYNVSRRKSFIVSIDSPSTNVVLERNYDLDVTSFSFPDSMFLGESKQFEVARIMNNGKKEVRLQFELGNSSFSDLFEEVEFIPSTLVLLPGEEIPLTLSVKVKEGASISNKKSGDEKKGKFIIKYLKETNKANQSFTTMLFPKPSVTISPRTRLSFGTINAGEVENKPIKISNKSKFTVSGVKMSVEITRAPNNTLSEVSKWFDWSRCPQKQECDLTLTVDPSQTINNLQVDVPISAQEDTVLGTIHIKSSGFNYQIPLELEIQPATILIAVSMQRQGFTINAQDSVYERERTNLVLENKGDVTIEDVFAKIENCAADWARIPNQSEFPISLNKKGRTGSKRIFEIESTAPAGTNLGVTQDCAIVVTYTHPLTRLKEEYPPVTFTVTTG